VQDVKNILSIQVHPSKEEAEKGFAREEAEGIPINAPHRNYKDRNHKPEVMVALSEFWLLHGFTSLAVIEKILEEVPEFNILLPYFRREGLKPFVPVCDGNEAGRYQCPADQPDQKRDPQET
jgi:mannose-6-phosphate isomerase